MSKRFEQGSVFIYLLIFFLIVVGISIFIVYKTLNTATKKIAQNTEVIKATIQAEYQNPFDKNTQYENPFSDYQNPFDNLK